MAQQQANSEDLVRDGVSAGAGPGARERELESEVDRLRTRLGALESELVEVQSRTNAIVGESQERIYWLDRWHIDLNALMRLPGTTELRAVLRAVRSVYRLFKRATIERS